MIIFMKPSASVSDIDYVVARVRSLGYKTHVSQDGGQTLVSILGDVHDLDPEVFAGLRGVNRVISSRQPFRLASWDAKSEPTVVSIGDIKVGSGQVIVIAGPCAVESREQMMKSAWAVKEAGAHMLRGGAFKPRTSPYSFQGLGEEGLKILADVRDETGLPIVTEVMTPEQVQLVSRYADVMQIGTRNMQNYGLLHAVGDSNKPVLLKRGMMSTVVELLMSAEYILSHGNRNVILCERGIRTFETLSRNTLDINAVPLLRELSHLPIVVDPSHATGKASLVTSVSKAAVAAGVDGLLIEVHHDPRNALSDGYQSLEPRQFTQLMQQADRIARATDRHVLEPKRMPADVQPTPIG